MPDTAIDWPGCAELWVYVSQKRFVAPRQCTQAPDGQLAAAHVAGPVWTQAPELQLQLELPTPGEDDVAAAVLPDGVRARDPLHVTPDTCQVTA